MEDRLVIFVVLVVLVLGYPGYRIYRAMAVILANRRSNYISESQSALRNHRLVEAQELARKSKDGDYLLEVKDNILELATEAQSLFESSSWPVIEQDKQKQALWILAQSYYLNDAAVDDWLTLLEECKRRRAPDVLIASTQWLPDERSRQIAKAMASEVR